MSSQRTSVEIAAIGPASGTGRRTTPEAPRKRRSTLRDIVRGKPIGHPTHAMVVHFPIAFTFAAVVCDLVSRFHPRTGLVQASMWLLFATLAGFVLATITGLADWLVMARGSRQRRLATQHMTVQLLAAALFIADGVARGDTTTPRAAWAWIALGAAGLLVLGFGNWLGGELVYRLGWRVLPFDPADTTTNRP